MSQRLRRDARIEFLTAGGGTGSFKAPRCDFSYQAFVPRLCDGRQLARQHVLSDAPKYQNAHPGNSDPRLEQVFLVNVLNALQKSPEWRETAVILNYDDSDGWYDHVSGPIINHSTNLGTADPSNPNIGGDNNETNANDSFILTLPLSTSTTPAAPQGIMTSGVSAQLRSALLQALADAAMARGCRSS
ncbi:MAG TPA: alkaline phosphatase family protein [Stellaceae bacterium]|nr:alkaline phosphatase family protein [Stellaceae bacterium]